MYMTLEKTRIAPTNEIKLRCSLKKMMPDKYIHGTVSVMITLERLAEVYLKPTVIIRLPKNPIKDIPIKDRLTETVIVGIGKAKAGTNKTRLDRE